MSSEDLKRFIEIVIQLDRRIQRMDERWERRLASSDAVIRELATEISQHLEYVHDTVILMLDRLDKFNIIRLDSHPTAKLRDRKVEEVRGELLDHYEKLRQLENETNSMPYIIEGKKTLIQENITRLENELKLLQD